MFLRRDIFQFILISASKRYPSVDLKSTVANKDKLHCNETGAINVVLERADDEDSDDDGDANKVIDVGPVHASLYPKEKEESRWSLTQVIFENGA